MDLYLSSLKRPALPGGPFLLASVASAPQPIHIPAGYREERAWTGAAPQPIHIPAGYREERASVGVLAALRERDSRGLPELRDQLVSLLDDPAPAQKAVGHRLEGNGLHFDAGVAECCGVGKAVVANRVVLRYGDQRLRQTSGRCASLPRCDRTTRGSGSVRCHRCRLAPTARRPSRRAQR